jgi:hypothetical protein
MQRPGGWRADQRNARQAFQRGEEMPEKSVRSRTYAFPLRHHIALSHILLPARPPRRARRAR